MYKSCKMIAEKIPVAVWNVHILQSESKTFSWRFAHMSYCITFPQVQQCID